MKDQLNVIQAAEQEIGASMVPLFKDILSQDRTPNGVPDVGLVRPNRTEIVPDNVEKFES